jgi:hypothetical protein
MHVSVIAVILARKNQLLGSSRTAMNSLTLKGSLVSGSNWGTLELALGVQLGQAVSRARKAVIDATGAAPNRNMV